MSMLYYKGSKNKFAADIIKHFPQHDLYIELFMGSGSIFFNKPLAKYNILNDIDDNLINFWEVVRNNKDELLQELENLPLHENLLKREYETTDKILKAALFLFKNTCSLYGSEDVLKIARAHYKQIMRNVIKHTQSKIQNALIMNKDYKKALAAVGFRNNREKEKSFCYCDPPYLNTCADYGSFTIERTEDLITILINSGIKFAMSEFDDPLILELAKKYNLNINYIKERRNIKNRRTEILLTNYINEISLFKD